MRKLTLLFLCLLSFSISASQNTKSLITKASNNDIPPQRITCKQVLDYPHYKQTIIYAAAAGYIAGRKSLRDKKHYFQDVHLMQAANGIKQFCKKNPDKTISSFVENQ